MHVIDVREHILKSLNVFYLIIRQSKEKTSNAFTSIHAILVIKNPTFWLYFFETSLWVYVIVISHKFILWPSPSVKVLKYSPKNTFTHLKSVWNIPVGVVDVQWDEGRNENDAFSLKN